MNVRHLLLAASVALATGFGSAPARAGEPDAEVSRLLKAGHSLKWNGSVSGKEGKYGHAEVLVGAPIEQVVAAVTNYNAYKDLAPEKLHNAKVVGKEGASTDVYMQVPIMHGLVNLWQVIRFAPVQNAGANVQVVEGKFVRGGSVKDANVLFTMRKVDANTTLLKMDLLIRPSVPAPESAIDEELRDTALKAVDALHDRAQGNRSTVTAVASN